MSAVPPGAAGEVAARVRGIVADVFGLDAADVGLDSGPATIERWDSVNHLSLVLALEGEFGVSFTPDQVDHFDRVASIVAALAPGTPAAAAADDGIAVRRLAPADVDTVVTLIRERDDAPYPREAVRDYLCGLEPERIVGWLALDGDEPAGMTVAYRSTIELDGRPTPVGYWAHLYVRESSRHRLVYPRLVHALMEGAAAEGFEIVYTGMRRLAVSDAHEGLGFAALGTLDVLVKPLKPVALLSRYKGWAGIETLGGTLDTVYRTVASALAGGGGFRVEEVEPGSPALEALLERREREAAATVHRRWTAAEWRGRFATTLEGGSYTLLAAHAGAEPVAGLLMRVAERRAGSGAPIPVGVVMDLFGEAGATGALLQQAEARAGAAGCLAMLWLDGVPALGRSFAQRGYWRSPETYRLIAWPPARLTPRTRELAHWRFPFAEHDAF
jgi:acyl carrier protein